MAKNLLLAIVSFCAFFLLLEGALALAGVEPALYSEDPFVGFATDIPLFVEDERWEGRLVTAINKRPMFNVQGFVRKKPLNAYRIFCLGGSTTYGRPFTDPTSFCGWLRAFLRAADPSRTWDVINAGGISYASYRVAALMEELIAYEPDLFILYTGHNEFLERRTYAHLLGSPRILQRTRTFLNGTRTYTILRRLLSTLAGEDAAPILKRDVLPGEVDALLDDSMGLDVYHRDDELRENVIAHFRFNLRRMAEISRAAGAELVLVTPASNLRDCTPFKVEARAGLTDGEERRFAALMREAERDHGEGDDVSALAALDRAAAIDARHAGLHHLRGRVLYALGRYPESKAAFQRAIDEDICPLRALSEMRRTVAEVAAGTNADLVDFASFIEERSAHGIPGNDSFLDHVHPTIEANRLLALELFEKLRARGIVHPNSAWNDEAIRRVSEAVEARVTPAAHGRALTNLAKVLSWAGKYEDAHALALRALEYVDDAETHYNAAYSASRLGRLDEAAVHYSEVLKKQPRRAAAHAELGHVLARQGKFDEAVPHLREAARLEPNSESAYYTLGHVLAMQGRYGEAIEELEEALRINPARASVHEKLANVLALMGDRERAFLHYEKAIALATADGRSDLAQQFRRKLAQVRRTRSGRNAESEARR